MVFVPVQSCDCCGSVSLAGSTDNIGNRFVVSKLMASKYPLCCISMELSEQMTARHIKHDLQWLPRSSNEEADALSNFNGSKFGFDPMKEVKCSIEEMQWHVLDDMLVAGAEIQGLPPIARIAKRARCKEKVAW